jgi:hypothetical protein
VACGKDVTVNEAIAIRTGAKRPAGTSAAHGVAVAAPA